MRIEGCPGLHVTIAVQGIDLTEHIVSEEEEDAETGKRYVQAMPGAQFNVSIRFGDGFLYPSDDIEATVYLDGQRVRGTCPAHRNNGQSTVIGHYRSFQDGQWTRQRFEFAELQTSDETTRATQTDALQELGTVRVLCRRGVKLATKAPHKKKNKIRSKTEVVHEKCLKGRAISSRATLGEAIPAKAPTGYRMEWPYGDDPIATFEFLYRSRRDLQAEGVLPRSPSPVPLEERDPESLTREEAIALVRRNQERGSAQVQVKQEYHSAKRSHQEALADDDADDPDLEVSFASERSKRSRPSGSSGVEIIDLSED
ncbi:hypothetical protein LTR17_004656 [Elasticomyces elasticus]|nr:hypothetical protein LTR17_004656 [Elasticomyces elasticus]